MAKRKTKSLEDEIKGQFDSLLKTVLNSMAAPNRIKRSDVDPSFLQEILNENQQDGGGGSSVSGFAYYVNENFSVYAERRQFVFSIRGDQNVSCSLETVDGGTGKTTLLNLNDIFLCFSNLGTGEVTINTNDLTLIKESGDSFTGNLVLKPGDKIAMQSTNVANQLLVEGQYADVTVIDPEEPATGGFLLDLGKSTGASPSPWSNMTTFPDLARVNLINTATSNTNDGWYVELPNGQNFQASGGTGPAGVAEFISSASSDMAYLSYAGASTRSFIFKIATGVTWKIRVLSSNNATGAYNGVFSINGVEKTVNASGGNTTVLEWTGIAPNAEGIIELVFRQASENDFCYINAISGTIES